MDDFRPVLSEKEGETFEGGEPGSFIFINESIKFIACAINVTCIAVVESDIFFFQIADALEVRMDTEEIFFVPVGIHIKTEVTILAGRSGIVDVILILQKDPSMIFQKICFIRYPAGSYRQMFSLSPFDVPSVSFSIFL